MRLQITTDYAIRIMLFMMQQNGKISTAEAAAKELGITYSYFNKVVHKIRMAGLLESIQGPNGGYCVTRGAVNTTLFDIVQVMEGDICINRCLDDDGFCSRHAVLTCPVHKALELLQNQIIDTLKSIKLRDLCSENGTELLPEVEASSAQTHIGNQFQNDTELRTNRGE